MYKIFIIEKCKKLAKYLFATTIILVTGCTKYGTGNNYTNSSSTTTTSGTSNTTTAPLPPLAGNGNTGSSGTNTGGGNTVDPNIPKAYIQGLFFTGLASTYVKVNDSVSLKPDGSYTPVYAGSTLMQYKMGSGATSDAVYTSAVYYLRPYSYYSYIVFKSPVAAAGETMLSNDLTTVPVGTTQIRFISLDPLTTSVPITFRVSNYLDNYYVYNRTYLDNRSDSAFNNFKTITPGFSNVSFIYKDSTLLTFSQNFESGRKYTVFAGALSYIASSKGTLPINYYQVARHN